MEGYLIYKKSKYEYERVYCVLDDQDLMVYKTYDTHKDTPVELKTTLNVCDGSVTKFKEPGRGYYGGDPGVTISAAEEKNTRRFSFFGGPPKAPSFTFICGSSGIQDAWYKAVEIGKVHHLKNEKRKMTMEDHKKVLNIENEENMTTKKLQKIYRRACLKAHPDKGGDLEEFKRIQEAYAFLMPIAEFEAEKETTKVIEYEAHMTYFKKKGLGLSMERNLVKNALLVTNVGENATVEGLSEEAKGSIEIGDALIGLDDEDVSTWPLRKISARLSRLPNATTVVLTFQRRVSLEEEEEEKDYGRSDYSTQQSPEEKSSDYVHPSWNNSDTSDYGSSNVTPVMSPINLPPSDFSGRSSIHSPETLDFDTTFDTSNENDANNTVNDVNKDEVNANTSERRRSTVFNMKMEINTENLDNKEDVRNRRQTFFDYDNQRTFVPRHRGSIVDISVTDPNMEPLHEMEELYDLLEAVRENDSNTINLETDGKLLREYLLIIQKHESAGRIDDEQNKMMAADMAHLRSNSARSKREAFKNLANLVDAEHKNEHYNGKKVISVFEKAKKFASEVESMLENVV